MTMFTIIFFVLTLLLMLNNIFTLVPILSFSNIYYIAYEKQKLPMPKLIKKLKPFMHYEEISMLVLAASFPLSILLMALYLFSAPENLAYEYLYILPTVISMILGLVMLTFELYPLDGKGLLDYKVLKLFIRNHYKKEMPKDIYQLVELYFFNYLENKDKFTHKPKSLVLSTFNFSKAIMKLTTEQNEKSAVYNYLLEPSTISVLASITNVLTDDKKLKFIDGTEGSETLKEYKKTLKEIQYGMEKIAFKVDINKFNEPNKDMPEDMNVELMSALNKAKENKHFVV